MEHWVVFVDESGKSSEPEEPFCLAGLVLQEEDHWANQRELRNQLEAIDPTIRYPFHAAHINDPAFHVANWLLARDGQRKAHPEGTRIARAATCMQINGRVLPPREAEDLAKACTLYARCGACLPGGRLRRETPAPLGALLKATSTQEIPKLEVLQAASAWLRQSIQPIWQELFQVRQATNTRIRDLLEALQAEYGPERCFAVAAADMPGMSRPAAGDRYLNLMTVFLERLYALFRSKDDAEIEIWIRPETTRVQAPHSTPLLAQHVDACVVTAARFPLFPPPAGERDLRVHVRCDIPSAKSPQLHPGLVLADYLANHLLTLLEGSRTWQDVTKDVPVRIALAPEAPARAAGKNAPSFAAVGRTRDAIRAAFELRQPNNLSAQKALVAGEQPGWTRDQAWKWISLAEVIR